MPRSARGAEALPIPCNRPCDTHQVCGASAGGVKRGMCKPPRMAEAAELVQELDERAHVLIGHSFGGAVAAIVAQRLPSRTSALIMVDSTVLPSGQPSVRSRAAALPQTFATFDEFAHHAMRLGRRAPERNQARPSTSLRWNARRLADGRWTWKYD